MARKLFLIILFVSLLIGFVITVSAFINRRSNPSISEKVAVTVTSNPPDIRGEVILNGEKQGVFNPTMLQLDPGIYEFSLQAYGFFGESQEVIIRGPAPVTITIKMTQQ